MPKPIPKIGDVVHVVFWDHAENFGNALRFDAYGKITDKTNKAYVIHCWHYHDDLDRARDSSPHHNETNFSIVRSAIESIKVLK